MTRTITISHEASDNGPQTLKTTTISHGPKGENHLKMWLSSFPLGIDPTPGQDFFSRIQFRRRIGNKLFTAELIRTITISHGPDNHNFTWDRQNCYRF